MILLQWEKDISSRQELHLIMVQIVTPPIMIYKAEAVTGDKTIQSCSRACIQLPKESVQQDLLQDCQNYWCLMRMLTYLAAAFQF